MRQNFWLQRIVEVCLLAIPMCFLAGLLVKGVSDPELNFFQRLFWTSTPFLFFNIVAIGLLQVIKKVILFFNQSTRIDILENLLIDIYILLFFSGTTSFTSLLAILLPILPNIISFYLTFLLDSLKIIFDDNGITILAKLFNLGIFIVFGISPIIFPLLFFNSVLMPIILFAYSIIHKPYYKYNSLISRITFFCVQVVKIIHLFSLVTLGLGILIIGILFTRVGLIVLQELLFNNSVHNLIITLFLIYLGLNMVLSCSTIVAMVLPKILGFTVSKVTNLSSAIDKTILDFIWFYSQKLSLLVKFLLPYSLIGIFSDYIYIIIVQNALSYSLNSNSTLQASEARKFATEFSEELLKKKFSLINIGDKYRFVISVASKLLLFGDLKFADTLYTKLWDSAKSHNEYVSLDEPFDALCYYFTETQQYKLLNSFINESSRLLYQNKISRFTYLANLMRSAYATKSYSSSTVQSIYRCLSWEEILSILLELPDVSEKSNLFKIIEFQSPEDLFKYYLSKELKNTSDEYSRNFIINNRQDLLILLATLQVIFEIQNQIYLFIRTQNSEYLPNENSINKALKSEFYVTCFDIKISVNQPFLRDNKKLIPLIHLFAENPLPFATLNKLIASANEQGCQIDLAFIKCCKGKLLIKNGLVQEGLEIIEEGIECYENIRNSVSTDQLGVGFGSNYLEYYDWAIDGLIQEGNFHKAFDYVERATARALIDLVSRKTSRSNSLKHSSPVPKLIAEIRDIDFNIYFLQVSTYEAPLFDNFLPPIVKNKLEKEFYKNKGEKLNYLIRKRDSLIKDIEAIDPVSATLVELKPFTWEPTSKPRENSIPLESLWRYEVISDKEAILSFHVIHELSFVENNKPWDKIVCFALFRERGTLRLQHHIVDNPEIVTSLQQKCQGIANEIRKKGRQPSLVAVSKNLIIPLLATLPDECNSLTITANSNLQFFPWSALYYNAEYSDSKRLINKFRIRTTPSLSLLYLLKQREDFRNTEIPRKFLVAGVERYPDPKNYLFWSGVEVEYISQIYTSNLPIKLKDEDVDLLFADEFRQAEVIHYTGHANYKESNSKLDALDKTYLCLYNKEISASEILNGALENPIAKAMILSACLTGRGDLTSSGSEILGLERALFHAGLSSLLTTLWPVEEISTALLMFKLHSVWHQHNNTLATLASSLREAQNWLRNVSWKELKQEFPDFENNVSNCIKAYELLMKNANTSQDERKANKFQQSCEFYQKVTDWLISESTEKPFWHPYFWAAFQVKGMG